MTETIVGMIQWLRPQALVKTIWAETEKSNTSSVKVLEKNGFKCFREEGETVFLKLDLL